MNLRSRLCALLVACCLSSAVQAQTTDPLPRAAPESVGMSSQRLARIGPVLEAEIVAGRLPGVVVAVARKGRLVYFQAFGYRDRAAGVRMTTDTIFNIASMSKPVTAVAALLLYEQGKLPLGDPLSNYLPEFTGQRVAVLDAAGETVLSTVPANRPVSIQDLLRHTSGIVYGRGPAAVRRLYPEGTNAAVIALSRKAFLERLSAAPLIYQPGTVWEYGFGLDLTGFVIEAVTRQPLSAYMQQQLFGPLGMVDTGFQLRPEQIARYARLVPGATPGAAAQIATPILTQPLNFECGGGCLGSTAGDYLRFAAMLAGKGRLGDTRLLGRKTVELMMSNQLAPGVKNGIAVTVPMFADYDFGLGVAVRTSVGAPLAGSPGDVSWPGFYGTWWWVDPEEDLAAVFMAYPPEPLRQHFRERINALVDQAIID